MRPKTFGCSEFTKTLHQRLLDGINGQIGQNPSEVLFEGTPKQADPSPQVLLDQIGWSYRIALPLPIAYATLALPHVLDL